MARVVLENLYKSFPHQRGQSIRLPSEEPWQAGAEPILTVAAGSSSISAASSQVSVLRNINLAIEDGEFMVLVGPSGCGKSTLLRLIAGLEQATGGNIWVGDRRINHSPPKDRDIAMVFQNYALYPHMTVYDNLAFGLRRARSGNPSPLQDSKLSEGNKQVSAVWQHQAKRWGEDMLSTVTRALPFSWRYWSDRERASDERVRTVAQILQIESLLDRLPKQLSGGQKQRVALGRAMARDPQVFLMDEPLSNLDAKLRLETRAQIVNLQRKLGTTTIYVTHDQTEAMTMGDRIAVMNAGQIQQVAAPLDLYTRPANRFVAEFIGTLPMNFIPVQVRAPLLITHAQFRLTLPGTWESRLQQFDGQTLILGIRPEHLSLSVPAPKNLPVVVERTEILGSEIHLTTRFSEPLADSQVIQVRLTPEQIPAIGEPIWLAIAPEHVHLFHPETQTSISEAYI